LVDAAIAMIDHTRLPLPGAPLRRSSMMRLFLGTGAPAT